MDGRHFYGAIGYEIFAAGTPAIVHVQIPAQPAEAASYDLPRTRKRENTIRVRPFEPSVAHRQ
jgi:hypothetical protein